MPQDWADDECFPFTKRDYDDSRSKNPTLLDLTNTKDTKLSSSSISEKTSREGSPVFDPIDPIVSKKIVELESQMIKSSVDRNKTMKFRKMLAEARSELSQSQMAVMKLNAEATLHDGVISTLKADANSASEKYEANITKFRQNLEKLSIDILRYKDYHDTLKMNNKNSYDEEKKELKRQNIEYNMIISVHQKEAEILRNIISKMKVSSDLSEIDKPSICGSGLVINCPCVRKPIVSLRFSRNRSPKSASNINPHSFDATPSSPSTQLPFMSPKKLLPYGAKRTML